MMRFFHQNLLASAKTVCEFLFLLCEVLFSKDYQNMQVASKTSLNLHPTTLGDCRKYMFYFHLKRKHCNEKYHVYVDGPFQDKISFWGRKIKNEGQ